MGGRAGGWVSGRRGVEGMVRGPCGRQASPARLPAPTSHASLARKRSCVSPIHWPACAGREAQCSGDGARARRSGRQRRAWRAGGCAHGTRGQAGSAARFWGTASELDAWPTRPPWVRGACQAQLQAPCWASPAGPLTANVPPPLAVHRAIRPQALRERAGHLAARRRGDVAALRAAAQPRPRLHDRHSGALARQVAGGGQSGHAAAHHNRIKHGAVAGAAGKRRGHGVGAMRVHCAGGGGAAARGACGRVRARGRGRQRARLGGASGRACGGRNPG